MTAEEVERVRYFERQYLTAEDLTAEQQYHRDMRRRHNLAHHTPGIVAGLRIEKKQSGTTFEYWVLPGMAVDGYGREIIVLAPARLDTGLFDAVRGDRHAAVWIGYDEERAGAPGYGWADCEDPGEAYRRTVETWQIVVEPGNRTHDAVYVDGRQLTALPEDEAVPYQELPDASAHPLWLVRLGTVHIVDGVLADTGDDRLNESRVYVRAVASEVLAPDDSLVLRPRTRFAEGKVDDGDFASVEGRLRVDGRLTAKADVHVDGGKVWLNPTGGPAGPDLLVTRGLRAGGAGHTVRVQLGTQADQPDTSLSVGPREGTADKAYLEVRANDVVDVPTGTLRFGRKPRQAIDLERHSDDLKPGAGRLGIGTQPGTLYQRSSGTFAWYLGGKHDDTAGEPGDGGATAMSLDEDGLAVTEDVQAGGEVRADNDVVAGDDVRAGGDVVADDDVEAGGDVRAVGNVTAGAGGDGWVHTRHVRGKSWNSDADDDLWLNWHTGRGVHVGARNERPSNLHVSGGLFVDGAVDSLVKVRTYELAQMNNGGNPRDWSQPIAGEFSTIYAVFAMLRGFSLWNNHNNLAFTNQGNVQGIANIPQHAYVRILGHDLGSVWGQCFCSESGGGIGGDNTVLFTVVVIGRKVT